MPTAVEKRMMTSRGGSSGVQDKAKRSRFGATPAWTLFVGIVGAILAATPARAVQIDNTEIELVVDPNSESMTAQVHLHLTDNTGDQKLVCTFLKPTRIDYCREVDIGAKRALHSSS